MPGKVTPIIEYIDKVHLSDLDLDARVAWLHAFRALLEDKINEIQSLQAQWQRITDLEDGTAVGEALTQDEITDALKAAVEQKRVASMWTGARYTANTPINAHELEKARAKLLAKASLGVPKRAFSDPGPIESSVTNKLG